MSSRYPSTFSVLWEAAHGPLKSRWGSNPASHECACPGKPLDLAAPRFPAGSHHLPCGTRAPESLPRMLGPGPRAQHASLTPTVPSGVCQHAPAKALHPPPQARTSSEARSRGSIATVHTAPGSEASGSRPCIQVGGSFCWFCLLNVFGVNRVLSSSLPPPRTTPRPRVQRLPVANASRALWLLAAHAAARASPSKPLKAVKWRRVVSRMEMKGTHVSGPCPAGPLSSTEVSAPDHGARAHAGRRLGSLGAHLSPFT